MLTHFYSQTVAYITYFIHFPSYGMETKQLNLPTYDCQLRHENDKTYIYDVLRRRYVALTPEEWVRQHFVHYMVQHLGYPAALMANEVELRCGSKRLRCDTLLYSPTLQPRMIVEYKSPRVRITRRVFDQIAAYNLLLHVDYLVVSNGMEHYCMRMDYDNQKYLPLGEFPKYKNILQDN